MPSASISSDIALFDLDGTLVDSTDAVVKTWEDYRARYGIDLTGLYEKSHGARTVETFSRYFPQLADQTGGGDIAVAAKLFDQLIALDNGHLAKPIAGAPELLSSINGSAELQKWAVCTSGSPGLAHAWFKTVLPVSEPRVFVTADDVRRGKPHPEPYLQGARLVAEQIALAKPVQEVKAVVFEDAPAGIKAGKAAGAVVVGILSSFEDPQLLFSAGADYVVRDLRSVKLVSNTDAGMVFEVEHI